MIQCSLVLTLTLILPFCTTSWPWRGTNLIVVPLGPRPLPASGWDPNAVWPYRAPKRLVFGCWVGCCWVCAVAVLNKDVVLPPKGELPIAGVPKDVDACGWAIDDPKSDVEAAGCAAWPNILVPVVVPKPVLAVPNRDGCCCCPKAEPVAPKSISD